MLLICLPLMLVSATSAVPAARAGALASKGDPLVLAFYYIWYSPGSWQRAKTDYPLVGRYASSDPVVVREHIRAARAAGIDGFIVSWKHEARLDEPLAVLVDEARRQDFKLVLLYQGLDFQRNPIDAGQIGTDLQWFAAKYAADPVFDVFGKVAVVWSGTWRFSVDQIRAVRSAMGAPGRLLLLGSERSAQDYKAKADVLDGDAYYWSSADPLTTPGYDRRLGDLADAISADGGLWIAPAAPGFDARLVGGTGIVPRRDGETYRSSWLGALRSNPSAIGIISWNEFSENSQIEPSKSYADNYVIITGALTGHLIGKGSALPNPSVAEAQGPAIDSSAEFSAPGVDATLSGVVAVILLIVFAVFIRMFRRRPV
ncbi:MAG: hypothetical protein M3R21_02150 [Candidatus Dormibacteraeota bacterium]|nr:hypothetical protein [Candidatus Dormibacteraeota bacterium]